MLGAANRAVPRRSRTQPHRMSKNPKPPAIDRRARRTRASLSEALIELGGESGIDALDVGALAEKAGIARSTFYTHFANKQDFFAKSFAALIDSLEATATARDADRRDLLPDMDLFAHVQQPGVFALQMLGSSEGGRILAAGETRLRAIAEAIGRGSTRLAAGAAARSRRVRRRGLRQIEGDLKQPPQKLHAAFAGLSRRLLDED